MPAGPRIVLTVGLLVLALAGALYLAERRTPAGSSAGQAGAPAETPWGEAAGEEAPAEPQDVAASRPGTKGRIKNPLEPRPARPVNSDRDALTARIQPEPDLALLNTRTGQDWKMDDYLAATASPEAMDGATAYAAFQFARGCVGEPRSDEQFEFRLEQYSQYAETSPRRFSPSRLDRAMDRLQDDFLRCESFGDEDLVKTASDWLMLAADLEYLPALVRFYQDLPELLRKTQARVFREPHYLDLHRAKSLEYLDRALLTGHPMAFMAVGIAIDDGVIYEPDPVAAHAYYTAASLAAGGQGPQIEEVRSKSEAALSSTELARAQRWGRNLCWEYCRLTEPEPMN